MAREEAAKMFNLSRLPESAGDTLRIVYIGDPDSPEGALDACPCIGEHVAHTAECGKFVWVSHEWKPDDGGVLRIPFQAGTLGGTCGNHDVHLLRPTARMVFFGRKI